MQFMKFQSDFGIHRAVNCPVELDIIEVTKCAPGRDVWHTFVVSTEKTFDEFQTWSDAVRFAEHKFGVKFDLEGKK